MCLVIGGTLNPTLLYLPTYVRYASAVQYVGLTLAWNLACAEPDGANIPRSVLLPIKLLAR